MSAISACIAEEIWVSFCRMFLSRIRPRNFVYTPRFYQKEKDQRHRISFQRKTLYDPHQGGMRFFFLLLLVLLVSLLIWYLIPRLSSVHPERTRLQQGDVIQLKQTDSK